MGIVQKNIFLMILVIVYDTLASSPIPVTCSSPKPPENAKIDFIECDLSHNSQCNQGDGADTYQEYDRVHFSCKQGFKLVNTLPHYKGNDERIMPVTCDSNGQWFPRLEQLGKCVLDDLYSECDSKYWFRCDKGRRCVPKNKRCNCKNDCEDGSDEKGCSARVNTIWAIHLKGKGSSGIISSPGYPQPKDNQEQFNCIYNITTLPNNHIQLDFDEFDLPKKQDKKCVDSVRLLFVHPEFLRKRRKRQRSDMIGTDSPLRTSQTKCGNKGFREVFSHFTHISISVTLGYSKQKKPYRGFNLRWKIKRKREFYAALYKLRENAKKEVGILSPQSTKQSDDGDDTMSTIVLPIALCGMLPLSFLAFFLCRRVAKQFLIYKSEQDGTSNKANAFTLTENNLAKLSEQLGTVPNAECRLLPPPVGNSNASNENKFQPLLHNKQVNCNSSQNSDLPRYIMSNEIPGNHFSKRPSSHSSHRHSSQNGHGHSNSSCPVRNSSNSLTHFNNNKSNHSSRHYSHEHINGSHELGKPSSCSSQSTNTCSLCHQGRRACNAEKINYLQHQQTTHRHSDYYSQPSDEFDDVYVPVSRHQYLKNTYPHLNESDQAGEYKEEEHYALYHPYLATHHTQNPTQPYNRNNSSLDVYLNMPPDMSYSDSMEDILKPHRHRVEKRKMIYLEEICDTQSRYISGSNELYGTCKIDTDRGGSILCTY